MAEAAPPTSERVVADDIVVSMPDGPRLIGSRCAECGTTTFPRTNGCPRCSSERMQDEQLPDRGTLWTFTTQSFPVKEPYIGPSDDDFVPYTVGYVQLDDVVTIEARLTEPDPEKLHIGMEMGLVVVPFATDDDGTDVLTFAFRPLADTTGDTTP